MGTNEEQLLALETSLERLPVATHARGSVIFASQRGLRARGFEQAYLAALDTRHRESLRVVIAASWVPMEAVLAHYFACDRLGLDIATVDAIASESGRFIYSSAVNVVMRLSTQAGITPWSVLTNLTRFCHRTWQGSGFEVFRRGPKEARVVWHGQPCAQSPYFSYAFGVFLAAGITPLCTKAYARLREAGGGPAKLEYRVSWA